LPSQREWSDSAGRPYVPRSVYLVDSARTLERAQSDANPGGGWAISREAEIATEQRHVDRVYARVETLRAEAQRNQREGHRLARPRTPGSLVERDAMVYHAARRTRALDAEYEGLVFGRLDLTGGEIRHIGRLGLRDANQEPLVVDWRAPASAAFYQATPEDPMGVIRRRVIRCSGPTVLGGEGDLLDTRADTSGLP